jgi:hypothetical protein
MLVILMEGFMMQATEMGSGAITHMYQVYEDWYRGSSNINVLPKKNLGGCNIGITDGDDL